MDKQQRVIVYKETIKTVKRGNYEVNGHTVTLPDSKPMVDGTKFYSKKVEVDYNNLKKYDTIIKVINDDCIYVAEEMLRRGLKPAMLNMASFSTPGGGVVNGSAAQEESIFRRTNIFKSLYQFHCIGENYGIKQAEERYPLNYNFGVIYTPNVTVFKMAEKDDCKLLERPFSIDVISCSAVKRPALRDGLIAPWTKDTILSKIRQIFDAALANGNDSLVLGAFGCGAYGTPPEQMAELFKKVIENERYKKAFKEISFAIIDDKNAHQEHNPNGNLMPFAQIFN